MPNQIQTPQPRKLMDAYTLSTPYGTVTIADSGRKVTFELYSDIKQSRHNQALFIYLQHLIQLGVTQYNVDHIAVAGADRRLSLTRGKAKLDLVYVREGKTYECELKTNREVGLDITAQQLTELSKHCEHLIVLTPRGSIEEMNTILHLINLSHRIAIQPYDGLGDEE